MHFLRPHGFSLQHFARHFLLFEEKTPKTSRRSLSKSKVSTSAIVIVMSTSFPSPSQLGLAALGPGRLNDMSEELSMFSMDSKYMFMNGLNISFRFWIDQILSVIKLNKLAINE